MASITKSFSLDPERDQDVLNWIENLPAYRGALSEAIIRAIRCEIQGGSKHQAQDSALDLILARLDEIQAIAQRRPEPPPPELPEDILGALDELGDL